MILFFPCFCFFLPAFSSSHKPNRQFTYIVTFTIQNKEFEKLVGRTCDVLSRSLFLSLKFKKKKKSLNMKSFERQQAAVFYHHFIHHLGYMLKCRGYTLIQAYALYSCYYGYIRERKTWDIHNQTMTVIIFRYLVRIASKMPDDVLSIWNGTRNGFKSIQYCD